MQNLQRLELLLPMTTVILLINTPLTPLMAFLPSFSYLLTQLCLQMVPGDHPPYKLVHSDPYLIIYVWGDPSESSIFPYEKMKQI